MRCFLEITRQIAYDFSLKLKEILYMYRSFFEVETDILQRAVVHALELTHKQTKSGNKHKHSLLI